MLQPEHPGDVTTIEFKVVVEYQPDRISPSQLAVRLSDALAWAEGVGSTAVAEVGTVDGADTHAYGFGV